MKRDVTRFSMLIVAFILTAQILALAPVAQGALQGGGKKRTYMRKIDTPSNSSSSTTGTRQSYRCIRRCRWAYNNCLSLAGDNRGRRRACMVRYRNCLNRCD